MNILNRLRNQPRRRVITAVSVAAALAAGVTVVALLPRPAAPGTTLSAPHTEAQSGTPTPTPAVAALPTADVAASFEGWTQDNEGDIASTITAEAGDAADGSIALRLESTNPANNPTRRALSQIVAVTPSTLYTFSASVKNTSNAGEAPRVAAIMGTTDQGRFDFPTASTGWAEETWTYTTATDETSLPISFLSVGPTSETRLDNLSMTVDGTAENLLINPSFEMFSAANPQITNSSLILDSGKAALGVSWRIPGASWAIADETESIVAEGKLDLSSGLAVVPLQDLTPGYYAIEIVDDANADARLETSLAILDPLAAGAPGTDDRFGVGVHFTPAYINSGQVAADLGISIARSDVRWNAVEKSANQYNFPAEYDSEVQDYAAAGVDFLPISVYSNKLYDRGRTPSTPEGIQGFANFTAEIAGHYGSPAIEIYNEFNNPPMNQGACGISAECYMPLLKASVDAIRARDPNTLIVAPATARQDDAWLTALYAAGGLDYIDAISFHPYDYTPTSGPEFLEASLKQATDRIREYNNGETKPIWITELGWSTTGYSEADQADNLVRAETVSFANGVEKFFWYDLVNDTADPAEHEGNFGLVRQSTETVPGFAPKPSGVAQAVLIRKIAEKAFTSRDEFPDSSVHSYVFGEGGDATRVAWSTVQSSVSYSSADPVSVTDQFGETSTLDPIDGVITVELDGHPMYIDGEITPAS